MLMITWLRRCGPYVITAVLIISVFPHAALAATGCNAVVSPDNVPPGTEVVLQFDIQNTGSQAINWIQINQPDVNYSVNGISQDNWVDATSETGTTLTGSSLAPGNTYSLQLAMQTGPSEEPAADWGISTSSTGDGSGSVSCGGQITTTIANPQAPPSPNGESNVGLTHLSATTATISWTSVAPSTSYVYYGTDASYGRTVTVAGTDSGHSVVLSGLTPNTVYHYKVAGSDENGNNYFSDDNTFVTPEAPLAPTIITIQNNVSTGTSNSSSTTVEPKTAHSVFFQAKPTETVPPVIGATTTLSKVYKDAPTIAGTATDNTGVALVEYSTDAGQDWLLADKTTGLGTKAVSFSFTPKNLDDGNYQLLVRVSDTSRNQAVKVLGEIVIDRLPPTVGGSTVSIGSQIIRPDLDGTMHALAGVDERIVLSAVGGPLNITIEASAKQAVGTTVHSFVLARSPSTGLWTGALSFTDGGIYQLSVKAFDGAGNQTKRAIGTIYVNNKGKTIDTSSGKSVAAKISVYARDPATLNWQAWAADAYGQSNPLTSTTNSGYSLYLPAGTYYLKAEKPGYQKAVTQSFTLRTPGPVSSDIPMKPAHEISIAGAHIAMPHFGTTEISLAQKASGTHRASDPVPLRLPNFSLKLTNGGMVSLVDTFGHPTVISLVSTWSPASQDQMPILADTARHYPELKVIPVSSGESLAHLVAVSSIAGYSVPVATDTTNEFLNKLGASYLPTHYFVNKSGLITKRVVGVLSEAEIVKYVEN
ncbi:MAG: hypothetical protein JWM81_425 [Candidatus Saccharibacteria bacterium]|nr:hypothetical protein [Candidatus Saccharibacteria bacterium]